MATTNTDQVTKQFESMFFGPMRSYAALTVEYAERALDTQFEFAKAYSNASIGQVRAMLDIKNPEDLRTFAENQQKVAKEMGERLKDDTEKVVAMNQEFAQKSQKLVEENVKSATQTVQKSAK
ncbi:phasin family protein [Modicisalibacter ilicicola DSM 19980]|uniref:Phasin family protein n=1 Tax=Modicisalibacter ilicicola DSM 19980 TaxID=1121942 RepID=A0A1M5A3J1_9GAMM|nr:phasin family protein [Halomonas ilicicola]SHF24841.1 phasin family protein [Halomonas ilicicola DSM 19980]